MAANIYPGVGPQNTDVANAVASVVPNTSGITSIVQANSYGNTPTLLASQAANSAATITLSWSGTYKKIYVILHNTGWSAIGQQILVNPNSDVTSANYAGATSYYQASTSYLQSSYRWESYIGIVALTQNDTGARNTSIIEIDNAASGSTIPKIIKLNAFGANNSNPHTGFGAWIGSAITSMKITSNTAATFSGGTIYIVGVN